MLSKPIQNPENTPYLDWIKSGIKTYEGRLLCNITKWELRVGNLIKFYDQDNSESYVICEITELSEFKDFGTAHDVLGHKLIPNHTRNEVIVMYNKLFDRENCAQLADGTTSEKISEVGVVAIGIKVIEHK